MEERHLDYLLDRYLAKEATAEELLEFGSLLQTGEKSLFTAAIAEKMQLEPTANIDNMGKWDRMLELILSVDKPIAPVRSRVIPIYRWAAAAVVFLAVIATWLWLENRPVAKDLATMGIADSIIATTREPRAVTLPDGTHIWLNAESVIRFPTAFSQSNRTIYLSGEAFFDVQHTDKVPFQVLSDRVTTTVLGTSFDVTTYPGKQTTISVQTGKVKVETATRTLAVLEKGTRLSVATDTTLLETAIDPQQIAAWRTGNLIYKNETLEDIVADVQRNFGDSIQIKDPNLKMVTITLSLNKAMGLKNALELITRIVDTKLTNKNGIYIIE
jgi:transmembrane sensor